MSEILVDYTQFEPLDLATQLHDTVVSNEALLRSRNFLGVIARYGSDLELAEQKVRKGQIDHEQGTPSHYAVVNEAGNVVGAASSYQNLPLRKLHLPIPSGLAKPPLAVPFKYANPNISAWTDINEEESLVGAYQQLVAMNRKRGIIGEPHEAPWTIEPIRSPKHIHVAIQMAGLDKVATRIFDDGESRIKIPPVSTLYTKSSTDWFTAHGRQKELKKGQWKSGWQEWEEYESENVYIGPGR
jgi:hypothetical protein